MNFGLQSKGREVGALIVATTKFVIVGINDQKKKDVLVKLNNIREMQNYFSVVLYN